MNINLIFEFNGTSITLPVNPENIEISVPGNNEKENIIGLGEIVILREPGLSTFDIESFFPRKSNPSTYIGFIENWRSGKKPAKFTASGLGISMQVAVEDFSYDRRSGEEKDIYYTLSLTEYRPYGAKIIEIKQEAVATPPAEPRIDNTPPVQQTYSVVSGDNLWAITRKLVGGSGSRWNELYEANKSVIGSNPNLIKPGQVFVVPQAWVK